MIKFNVFSGVYPYTEQLGEVEILEVPGKTEDELSVIALQVACDKFGGHPVVQLIK
jgi:hypothetical protein